MSFVIRNANPDDARALAELAERIFRVTFEADNNPDDLHAYLTEAYGERQQRREILDPQWRTFVVEREGTLIAYAQLRLHEDVEIYRFYVDHAAHGSGVAQALMKHARDFAVAHGATRVWLGVWERNFRAIRFYEKCGFVDYGSHPFVVGTDVQTDRLMEWRPDRP
jgi:ribosomal protein S18 acetylase RimI-like enzyme